MSNLVCIMNGDLNTEFNRKKSSQNLKEHKFIWPLEKEMFDFAYCGNYTKKATSTHSTLY